MPDGAATLTLRTTAGALEHAHSAASLLVFESGSCTPVALPSAGEVTVGRSPDASIPVRDPSTSRLHLKLLIAGPEVRALDLGSHNGTRVNGQRITGSHPLAAGDVIALSSALSLVFVRAPSVSPVRPILSAAELRARVEEEVGRAVKHGRPLALIAIEAPPAALEEALAGRLRLYDVVGRDGEDRLLWVAPETGAAEAGARAAALASALADSLPRAGVAACPGDALDADSLIAAARDAARKAPPGKVGAAADAADTLRVGDLEVIVADGAMRQAFALLEKLAQSELPVLVQGETGTGKEVAARALHAWSRRAARPFLPLNCAALPEGIAESELFGHERGAFSGAAERKIGLLEAASGGTLFLDELGELSPQVQAKLLRALETRKILRVGAVEERPIDVRLVAATHQDLEAQIAAGRFRRDLFFRLSAARVVLPPLRQRRRELSVLARVFLERAAESMGRPPMSLAPATLRRLLEHDWPGNVRELKNAMEFAAATAPDAVVEPWQLPDTLDEPVSSKTPAIPRAEDLLMRPLKDEIEALERARIIEALERTGGVQARAAELIDVPIRTFVNKMKAHGISPRGARRTP